MKYKSLLCLCFALSNLFSPFVCFAKVNQFSFVDNFISVNVLKSKFQLLSIQNSPSVSFEQLAFKETPVKIYTGSLLKNFSNEFADVDEENDLDIEPMKINFNSQMNKDFQKEVKENNNPTRPLLREPSF
ncbi:MAG: hypothetical protein QNJ31_03375 [Candidatus Caenarcaniphilales bacterium]|nr:hypothetical protein [Candidatus Caenarcaniphilales bacterium]